MRPKVILGLVMLALICGAGLFLARNRGQQTPSTDSVAPLPQAAEEVAASQIDSSAPISEKANEIITATAAVQGSGKALTAENPKPRTVKGQLLEDRHREDVENRASELMDLAMNDDTNSLHTILSELNNPDPEIRQAALDATIQFGSTNAIPGLESASLWNESPEEKQQIADAIEFLKLPQLGDPAFPITGSSKGPVRKPATTHKPLGARR
jgi:hypothetical protein